MGHCGWHGSIVHHKKTRFLESALKLSKRDAVGLRGCLYAYAVEHTPSGILPKADLQIACESFDIPADQLLQTLLQGKLVDPLPDDAENVSIHDFLEYCPAFSKAVLERARYYVKMGKPIPPDLMTLGFAQKGPNLKKFEQLCLRREEKGREEEAPPTPSRVAQKSGSAGRTGKTPAAIGKRGRPRKPEPEDPDKAERDMLAQVASMDPAAAARALSLAVENGTTFPARVREALEARKATISS